MFQKAVIILFFLTIAVFAQDGSMPENRVMEKGKPAKNTKDICRAMKYRLEKLDDVYIEKLNSRDKRNARLLIDELFKDIELLERTEALLVPPPPPPPMAMPEADFSAFLSALKKETFDIDKKQMLLVASRQQYFLVDQVTRIMKEFFMSSDKIEVVRTLYPTVLDRYNAYKLVSAFTFSSEKEEVRKIIESFDVNRK